VLRHKPVYDQIITPKQLFDWEHLNLTNMNVILATEELYKEKKKC
jgi:hypothetical protein